MNPTPLKVGLSVIIALACLFIGAVGLGEIVSRLLGLRK